MTVDSLPSFDLSRLLIGHTVLSSLAALYSNDVPQWNIPLALYGLATIQSSQVTSESLSTVSRSLFHQASWGRYPQLISCFSMRVVLTVIRWISTIGSRRESQLFFESYSRVFHLKEFPRSDWSSEVHSNSSSSSTSSSK